MLRQGIVRRPTLALDYFESVGLGLFGIQDGILPLELVGLLFALLIAIEVASDSELAKLEPFSFVAVLLGLLLLSWLGLLLAEIASVNCIDDVLQGGRNGSVHLLVAFAAGCEPLLLVGGVLVAESYGVCGPEGGTLVVFILAGRPRWALRRAGTLPLLIRKGLFQLCL